MTPWSETVCRITRRPGLVGSSLARHACKRPWLLNHSAGGRLLRPRQVLRCHEQGAKRVRTAFHRRGHRPDHRHGWAASRPRLPGCSGASLVISRPVSEASRRAVRSSSRCSPLAICSLSDEGCRPEAKPALGRGSRRVAPADTPKSPASAAEAPVLDSPDPKTTKAEALVQPILQL